MLLKRLIFCFSNVYRCFTTSLRGKVKRAKVPPTPRHAQARSMTCVAVMVLLNFYLHTLIHYYFIASHLIYFIIVFICRALSPPDTDMRPFLRLCTMRASRRWPKRGRCGRRFPRLPRSRRSARASSRLPRSQRAERPNMRLPRSQTSERPSMRLLRSQTLRMRLVTSHRSPTG
jgi:hypothetical protein